ncbi:transmembrane protein, putative [Bodo saltans]|uniref:Transmembrane protein, putative n=1 Tax=Bodo saltans TaxID=75058 RepID=A0A0S4JCG9_BODSA|nr:transmembrane protein, putative [Bodo saltans]|eukprot:CUG89242.1 transmembrane protein, putative [Bodo saltans]
MGNKPSTPPPPPPAPEPEPSPPQELAWYNPGGYSILFHKVKLEDYPWIKNTPMLTEYPGLALWELSMFRAVRYSCFVGFAVSPIAWYIQRKRLPFADRPLYKMHHVFFPSAGYSTFFGFAAGTVESMWTCYQEFGGPRPVWQQEKKLVKAAVIARMDKDNDRWCRTAGRLGFCGLTTTFFFWKSGGPFFRAAMGFGTGVTIASIASVTRLDRQVQLF